MFGALPSLRFDVEKCADMFGLRQGCLLAATLCPIYIAAMLQKMSGEKPGTTFEIAPMAETST